MLWDCTECGCGAIAGSLDFCPQCFSPRSEVDVPAEAGQPVASDEGSSRPSVPASPQAPDSEDGWGDSVA
jgi:hypothetical protein